MVKHLDKPLRVLLMMFLVSAGSAILITAFIVLIIISVREKIGY